MGAEQAAPPPSRDERTRAALGHVGAALVSFVAPVLVLLARRPAPAYVRAQAVESINFQLTVVLAYAVAAAASFVVSGYFLLLFPVIFFVNIVACATAAFAVRHGRSYAYPRALRPIK